MFDYTHQYSARIVINDKTEADEYYHTDGNTYVEARKNSEYSLELANNSTEVVLMVPAIDGLSVIDGQPAGLSSPGYIVKPNSSMQITGWLKNNKEVARFVFWDKDKSYSNMTGRGTENTGVIGILIFREKPLDITFPKYVGWTASASASANTQLRASSVSNSVNDTGTGHGRLEEFHTNQTFFEKRDPNHPDSQIVLYYDTSKGLERRGITLRYKSTYAPDPFPSSPGYIKKSR